MLKFREHFARGIKRILFLKNVTKTKKKIPLSREIQNERLKKKKKKNMLQMIEFEIKFNPKRFSRIYHKIKKKT